VLRHLPLSNIRIYALLHLSKALSAALSIACGIGLGHVDQTLLGGAIPSEALGERDRGWPDAPS
jgi:hypothetical protein